jgi:hypothetical protein
MARAYLSKADLLAGITLKPQDFEVPGLGWVQVRGLSMNEMQDIRTSAGDNEIKLMLLFAHRGLANPQFALNELETLGNGSAGLISSIGQRVLDLSALGDKKEIDPLAGNGS